MSKIKSVGLHFAKKSDDLTWNDPPLYTFLSVTISHCTSLAL